MRESSVILTSVPYAVQTLGQLQGVGDLGRGKTQIHVVQCLVVDELIYRSGIQHILADGLGTPVWPVVTLENHIGLVAKFLLSLQDIVAPCLSITNLSTAQSIEVVQGTGTVLCHPECAIVSKVGIHLCRSLCARGNLEGNGEPVNDKSGILCDFESRRHEGNGRIGTLSHTDTHSHAASDALGQVGTVLIASTT